MHKVLAGNLPLSQRDSVIRIIGPPLLCIQSKQ